MQRYEIAIFVPGLPFDGESLETGSLGGSETAGLCMARELAAIGHHVTMFCNTQRPGGYDGVNYQPAENWGVYATATPFDIAIVQRAPEQFIPRLGAKLNLLWCHDLALKRSEAQIKGVMWNVDKVMVLSQFMEDQYKDVYGLPDEALWRTRNGIDLELFPESSESTGFSSNIERDSKRLIYTSRPERGLDVLLRDILPELLKRDPEFKLVVAGYDNKVPHMQPFYDMVDGMMANFGDRVERLGALNKRQLYAEYARAGCYVYPTPSPTQPMFAEVSCITAMECQAAGLPIVASDKGALSETIADGAGILVKGVPGSEEYTKEFCDAVEDATNKYGSDMAAIGEMSARDFSWKSVAEEWSIKFDELIAERNDDPLRLARHFIRHSEIEGAEAVLNSTEDNPAATALLAELDEKYSFLNTPESYAAHYAAMGEATLDRLNAPGKDFSRFFEHSDELRFHVMEQFINERPEIQRVLDYGCGHGWCDIYLHNKTGRGFVGIDVDLGAMEKSIEFCGQFAKDPTQLTFFRGDHTTDLSSTMAWSREKFDMLICSEVLEHLREDPAEVIDSLEQWVKDDGWVFITVPYGPREYGTDSWNSHRNHVREFDSHDLRDMFGDKKDCTVQAMAEGGHALLHEPVGCWIVTYRKDSARVTGRRDLKRKLGLQRPRETVSVNIIAGPNSEAQLGWCLNSVKDIADEIVIADTGMSTDAHLIAERFGARMIKAPNPLEHGFEAPRNTALDASRMDWILWIDTDECLVDPGNLQKYLRGNLFDGYSVKQHHFAVDTQFSPDLPVRLFRRNSGNRFFGMIHEHPEKELNKGPGQVVVLADTSIAHTGYLSERGRRMRFGRNLPLLAKDKEKYPKRILQKHFIMRDNMLLNMYELQTNGGQVTDAINQRCNETIELYREYFLGKGMFANVDSLQYYSQACETLGIGIDMSFDIKAGRDGIGNLNGGEHFRFATTDDFLQELTQRAKSQTEQFNHEYW